MTLKNQFSILKVQIWSKSAPVPECWPTHMASYSRGPCATTIIESCARPLQKPLVRRHYDPTLHPPCNFFLLFSNPQPVTKLHSHNKCPSDVLNVKVNTRKKITPHPYSRFRSRYPRQARSSVFYKMQGQGQFVFFYLKKKMFLVVCILKKWTMDTLSESFFSVDREIFEFYFKSTCF